MLHLSTTTGLTLDTASIPDLGDALRAEITAHADTVTVGWQVAMDGLAGVHAGDITVYWTEGDHQEWIDESVQWLIDNLNVTAAAHPHLFTTTAGRLSAAL